MSSRNPEKINAIIEAAGGWILDHPKFAHFSIRPRGTSTKILLYEYTIDRKVPLDIIEVSCRAEVGFIQSVLKDYGWDDQFEVVYEVLDKDTYDGNIPDADLEFMVDDINDEWIAEASREEDEYIKDTFSNWGGILHLSGWCYSWAVHELTGSDYVREIEFYVQYPKDTDSRDAMKDMRSIIEDLTSKKDNPYQYDVAVWMGDPPAGHRTVSPEYIREVLGV